MSVGLLKCVSPPEPGHNLSVWSVAYVFISTQKHKPTKRLPGFLAGWRNGLPRNSNLLKITFSVKCQTLPQMSHLQMESSLETRPLKN